MIPEGSTVRRHRQAARRRGDHLERASSGSGTCAINGGGPFQAGTYELAKNSAIADVIDVLDAGPAPIEERTFTVPEALTAHGDPRPPRRPREGPRPRSRRAPAAHGQRADPLVGPARRPAVERGHPLPRDVPRSRPDADEEAVLRKLVGQLESVMTELNVASAQERFNLTPYEVLDRRVAHRGGDEGRRRARQGRPRDLQPAQPGHPARHRRHLALRGGARQPATARTSTSRATRPTTPAGSPGSRPRRSRRPAAPASRRRSTPPTGRGSTTCSRTPRATTSSPTATASSSPPRSGAAEAGLGCG